ncbi:MAG TPA: hypothetical protein VLH09_14080, partial [Bryobacteraceae bacterium]|nr:hypothetical protein [Bryobacteraceae bacterium]
VGAFYNVVPIRQVAEVWRSAELRLSIMVRTSDSLKRERTELYRDIVVDKPVDPSLFTIPAGFQVIESGSTAPAAVP